MNQNEFKVFDWLRDIRDQHSEQIKHLTTDEILKDANERSAKFRPKNINESNQQYNKETDNNL